MDTYQLKMVNRSGGLVYNFPDFDVTEVKWRLNAWGSLSFNIGIMDAQASLMRTNCLKSEIQLWRNGILIFWGPLVRAEAGFESKRINCQALGLLYYFARRHAGPPSGQYPFLNKSFESGMANWSTHNSTTSATSIRARNDLGIMVSPVNAATAPDAYIYQTITVVDTSPAGFFNGFTVSAWSNWVSYVIGSNNCLPPYERGLYVNAWDRSTASYVDENWSTINNNTPKEEFIRHQVDILFRTGVTTDIQLRLYAPGLATVWDAVSAATELVIGGPGDGGPLNWGNIVWRLANSCVGQTGLPNPDFRITIGSQVVSSVKTMREFLQSEQFNFYEAMQEAVAEDALDFDVVWNAGGTTRTFESYAPRKGSHKTTGTVKTGPGGNVKDFAYDVDGQQTSTDIRLLHTQGGGSGPTREYGWLYDIGLDGLLLSEVLQMPSDIPLDAIDRLTYEAIIRKKNLVRIPKVTVWNKRPNDLVNIIKPGDTISLILSYGGFVQENATWRVMEMTYRPREDTVELELNLP